MKKKFFIAVILFLVVIIIVGVVSYFVYLKRQTQPPNPPNVITSIVIDCGDSYDCLGQQVSQGKAAKVVIDEKITSLNLEEKSEVKIEPANGQFRVTMTELELKKIVSPPQPTKSIVGSIVSGGTGGAACPKILDNLLSLESTTATCLTDTADEAWTLAKDGLSDSAIKKYSCQGSLIDEIKRICTSPDYPNFPPYVKKPAVYLYPEQPTKVSVAVDLKGIITKSDPEYYQGWEVTAEPGGLINGQYDYLFYEAQLDQLQLPREGWVVAGEKLENWFDSNLPKLGLNGHEKSQFKEYWLAELPPAEYYEIKLLSDSFLAQNMNLKISPQPTTLIRRDFYFQPLEKKIILAEPRIITPERKGFTVVEWGGMLNE
ncbi:MAG: hypothetical protein PHE24_01285 [Patescibacteria group bacterium]|nr:hypothetical protein [Patescibacteria group bacterium]